MIFELSYLTAPLLGGIIDYITNDIAIRMLFRPHTAKYIFGVHIPFTPGIIPKEKGRIAEAIGSTISENLMNKEVLEKYLLSDEMVGKIRSSIEDFTNRQRTNNETFIAIETYTKLADPIVGETVAKVAMDHVGKSLSGDGAKILLAGIGGLAKGIGGIANT